MLALAALVTGCTPVARSTQTYESKAATTAEKMESAVASGELVAMLSAEQRAWATFASAAAGGAEREGDDVASTFDAIQPPDQPSDNLRNELDPLLQQARDELGSLRVAARRGGKGDLAGIAADLHKLGEQLDAFQNAHQQS